ncbi:helix-turn-helix domain-containing protein [Granulicella paludicola]|uniref:helix-turn-helix domain-containing protein n=1 Tax=Granulicella paludicola TaxID=474951 RepID=UPI0021DFB297|nr:helix-turn-helix domain-containing protein [Granulicella paludicola]
MNQLHVLSKRLNATTRTERARRLNPEIDREYIVPILIKSVAILELLRDTPQGLKICQIHAQTGIALSTIYRIVRTFVVSNYIELNCEGFYVAK